MSTRERILIWMVALLVGFFALDRLIVSPLQSRLSRLSEDIDIVQEQIDEGMLQIDNRDLLETRWSDRVATGLDLDPAASRLRVQGQLSDFAEDAGLSLTNLSAGGNLDREPFTEIRFSLTATGELRSVTRFIEQIQEASIPLALMTCDISRRDESNSRLTLRLTVSTLIYMPKEPTS